MRFPRSVFSKVRLRRGRKLYCSLWTKPPVEATYTGYARVTSPEVTWPETSRTAIVWPVSFVGMFELWGPWEWID